MVGLAGVARVEAYVARTPEQRAADEKLTEAINATCAAYGYMGPDTVNLSYAVLVEQRVFSKDEDGDESGLITLMKDGDIPWIPLIGLLRAGLIRAEHNFNDGGRED